MWLSARGCRAHMRRVGAESFLRYSDGAHVLGTCSEGFATKSNWGVGLSHLHRSTRGDAMSRVPRKLDRTADAVPARHRRRCVRRVVPPGCAAVHGFGRAPGADRGPARRSPRPGPLPPESGTARPAPAGCDRPTGHRSSRVRHSRSGNIRTGISGKLVPVLTGWGCRGAMSWCCGMN